MMNRPSRLFLVSLGLICLLSNRNGARADFLYAGTLEATKVDLSSRLASTVAKMSVQEGTVVLKDQELAALSCEDHRVNARLAQSLFVRNEKLYRSGTISEDVFEQFRSKKESADIFVSWCSIKSPIDGTVTVRYREPGEWVNPGAKLLTLANLKELWTYIYLPQPEIAKIKLGQKVLGTLPEVPGQTFSGSVVKINAEAEFTPKNVQTQSERTRLVFGVKVAFPALDLGKGGTLKPGMIIDVTIVRE